MSKRAGIIAIGIMTLIIIYFVTEVFSGVSNPAEQTYLQQCAGCHGEKGEGLGLLIPPLAGADWLRDNQDEISCIIKYGMKENIVVNGQQYTSDMLGIENLSAIQMTNIINYINSSWGNDFGYITTEEVEIQLENCKENY